MAAGKRDANRHPVLIGVSSADDTTPVPLTVDPTTGRLRIKVIGNTGNTGIPDREITRRDENRVPTIAGQDNTDDTIKPLSVESASDGLMCEGA